MAVAANAKSKQGNKFALRLMPSVRQGAERILQSEGVSLNQFINVAIAEKVARLEHQRWAANREPFSESARAEGLGLLRRGKTIPPDAGDEIPRAYVARKSPKIDSDKVRGKLARARSGA